MNVLVDLFNNGIFMIAALSWFFAQLTKIVINLLVERRFIIERLWGDGGMPSGHSATVTALAGATGWCYGFDSVYFAIAAILAIVVMHDAMGVRREAGKQAASIKEIANLINELAIEHDQRIRTDKLKELVGHTPLQVFFGFMLGTLVTLVAFLVLDVGYCSGGLQLF